MYSSEVFAEKLCARGNELCIKVFVIWGALKICTQILTHKKNIRGLL